MSPAQPPLPAWLDSPGTTIVGRRTERELLNECWDEVTDWRRQIVLIGGDAGIGKSRLVSELATNAHSVGAIVLGSVCERDYPRPFQPFVDAMHPLLSTAAHADEAFENAVGLISGEVSANASIARHRLFESMLSRLTSAAEESAVVLILEDLHWAKAPTLELFEHMARHTSGQRLLMVGTFRPPPQGESPELRASLTEVHRHPGVIRVDLGGLSIEDVVDFLVIETRKPRHQVLEPASTLRDLTGGNPFYLREIWHTLGKSEGLGGRLEIQSQLPETVGEAVQARMSRVVPTTARVLTYASVLGSANRPDTIARISEFDVDETLASLEEAVDAGLMSRGKSGSYSFVHDLTRQAILDALPSGERALLHEGAALSLQEQSGEDPAMAATLAHHYGMSLRHPERTGTYHEIAGEHFERALAYEEAAGHFLMAAEYGADPIEADRLTVRAASNLLLAGRFSAAADLFDRVKDSADAVTRARGAIGLAESTWRPGRFGHEAATRLIKARKDLGSVESAAVGVELRCYLALALGYAGLHDAALEIGQAAVEDARKLGDGRLEAKALLYPKMTSPDLSQPLYEQVKAAHQLVVESGDLDLLGLAAYMRGSLGYVMGDPEAWTGAISDLVHVVDETDQPFHRLALYGSMCSRAFTRGEYEQALGHADAGMEMAERFGDDPIEGLDGAQRFMINRETGLEQIKPLIKGIPDEEPGPWRLGLLAIYVELGMSEPARVVLDEVMDTPAPRESAGRYQGAKAAFLAEAIASLGHRRYAEQLYEILGQRSGTNLIWGHFVMVFGSADRYLGILADVMGRDAQDHFEQALEMDTSMGSTQHRAETLARYATYMAERDAKLAKRLAAEADELGRLMGSRRVCRLASLDQAPMPDGLTAREIEVLRLIAEGRSNREIAEKLFVSLNTATNHVRSILIKTGCSNRTQAARYAVDSDLIAR